jgi:NADH-quinone oxidoreductase subunit G
MAGKKVTALVGDLVSTEAAYALQQVIAGLGGKIECRTDGAQLPMGNRSGYVGTARIEDLETAQMIQLIGTNPKMEAPVLNARIRKAWSRGATIGLIGEPVDLTYDYVHVGTGRADLQALLKKDYKACSRAALRGGSGAGGFARRGWRGGSGGHDGALRKN